MADQFFAAALEAEFGDQFEDLRAALPDRPGFRKRPLAGITDLALHHSASPQTTTWKAIQDGHFARGFSGIGYTAGVRRGRVALFGDPELARACCKGINHLVLCVVVAGDYTRDALDPVDLDLLRRLVGVIDAYLGRELPIRGHGQLPGQATACPGGAILAAIPGLRGAAPIPAAPAPETALRTRLSEAVAGRWLAGINPNAGLQRAIRAAHYAPLTHEWEEIVDGTAYICQGAQGVEAGRLTRRVYYVERGRWDSIRFMAV